MWRNMAGGGGIKIKKKERKKENKERKKKTLNIYRKVYKAVVYTNRYLIV